MSTASKLPLSPSLKPDSKRSSPDHDIPLHTRIVMAYKYEDNDWNPCASLIMINNFENGDKDVLTTNDPMTTLASPHGCVRSKVATPGGMVDIPRDVCIVSENGDIEYKFANQKAHGVVASLLEMQLMHRMNGVIQRITGEHNSVNALLKNFYTNGWDSVAEHQDNEEELIGGVVAAVSFGGKRKLVFRKASAKKFMDKHKFVFTDDREVMVDGRVFVTLVYNGNKYRVIKNKYEWIDPTGCLWMMVGKEFQTLLTHEVPKTKTPNERPRLSFTGRKHNK